MGGGTEGSWSRDGKEEGQEVGGRGEKRKDEREGSGEMRAREGVGRKEGTGG